MQKLIYTNKTYNFIQKFVIEKLHELCYNRSLDSYRARTLNPKSSLEELYKVLHDWNKNKIKDFATVKACLDETISFIETEEIFEYRFTSKNSFIKLLSSIKDENSLLEIEESEYSIYYILEANEDYTQKILKKLNDLIKNPPKKKDTRTVRLIQVDMYTGYLVTELINIGYSKSYILKLVQAILVYGSDSTFKKAWKNFTEIFLRRKKTEYAVIFTVTGSKSQFENFIIEELADEVSSNILGLNPIKKIENYVSRHPSKKFVTFLVEAYDYYQALKLGKSKMSVILDKIHLGFSNIKLTVKDTALLINQEQPEKGDLQPIYYQIDGYYKSNSDLYKTFIEKLENIESKTFISNEVKERLQSALRYFRLGNESIELEKKFVNYWIGLEFVFSSYNINENTFQRLKKFLITSHLVHYVKRNLVQLHNDIKTFSLDESIQNYDSNLKYLLDSTNYERLISDFSETPLLSYRCSKIKSYLLINSEKRQKYLDQHKKHLNWHLIRIYRVRNELIHDAAIIENIENLTGNLRYYLSFILNKVIEFFAECNPKPEISRDVTMNDFFLHQEMILQNIKNEKYSANKMIEVPFTFDYLF